VSLAALVLAAGRGERLRPLTDETPKPLLRVGDTTLLDAALARVASVVDVSPDSVTVNAHWLAEQIVTHVDGRAQVSIEQPVALGTAGAVGAIHDWLGERDLLVANGDCWWTPEPDIVGFVEDWDRDRPRLLVVDDEQRPDFGGRWRFAGVSLLPNRIAAALPVEPSGLYEQVWRDAAVDLVPTGALFIDCGTYDDLELARARASAD